MLGRGFLGTAVCIFLSGVMYELLYHLVGGVAVELKSHLPIERQARVIGATWLDQLKPAFGERRFFFEDEQSTEPPHVVAWE